MTLLQKAYNILSKDDIKREKPFIPTVKRPAKAFTFNSFNIPEVRSKKCTKEKLSKVLAFIEMKKYSRYSDGFTVMAISVKNKRKDYAIYLIFRLGKTNTSALFAAWAANL